MKKFLSLFIVFSIISSTVIFSYASMASWGVRKLATAAAVAGSGGARTLPAWISGTTSAGASAAGWIALALPSGAGVTIAGCVLGIAGGLAADYLFNAGKGWFDGHGINSDLERTTTTTVPNGMSLPDWSASGQTDKIYAYGTYYQEFYHGWQGTQAEAQAKMIANYNALIAAGEDNVQSSSNFTNPTTYSPATWSNGCVHGYSTTYRTKAIPRVWQTDVWYWGNPSCAAGVHTFTSVDLLGIGDVTALLQTDLTNGVASADAVIDAALSVAGAAAENPNHPMNMNAAIKAAYENALKSGVSAGQLSNLESGATTMDDTNAGDAAGENRLPINPAEIAAAVQAALAGQGLSASQIAAAIAAAQGAAAGGLTQAQAQAAVAAALAGANLSAAQIQAAVDASIAAAFPPVGAYTGGQTIGATAWVAPAVGDFAALFSSFLNDMRNTPLFSLPGLLSSSVPSGGSCEMSINMSQRFGGTKTISICNWETGLSGVKAALLCVASIFAVGIVVKGGG